MSEATSTAAVTSPFEISYAKLPEACFARVAPTAVSKPALLQLNVPLAEQLGLSPDELRSPAGVALLSGNRPFEGANPIAMAYAGHQFGNWVPSLGDGRAVLIAEVVDQSGVRRDIQLKGAGRTPFSRRGDGRAALGPVLREYVLSEAMFKLGIPTTRALAMVTTGESIVRERTEPGAILTRVASGHVRVGTFQYLHGRGMTDELRALADHVTLRRFPDAAAEEKPYRALLDRVIECQADLITRWLLVGFIHGVMNTDNMSVMGETIDYGPCAFMDDYVPAKVFSSIDQRGRYAYNEQPGIGLWNLTRFAETLLPLLAGEEGSEEAAVEAAQDALGTYRSQFQTGYDLGLCRKLGFREANEANLEVVSQFLDAMAEDGADFTLSFRRLSELSRDDASRDDGVRSLFDTEAFDAWALRWRERLRAEGRDDATRQREMRETNPAFIPRNHQVQHAIDAAIDHQDLRPLELLLQVTAHPFDDQPSLSEYALPPEPYEVVHQTFCGT